MRTWMTPVDRGAMRENTSLARSMIRPSTYGPRSETVHVAVAPLATSVMCTTVPLGSVRWAHVPGGAASYQLAPPLWVLPEGAAGGAALGAGADLDVGVAVIGRGAGRVVLVARRGTVEEGATRGAARYRFGL